MKLMVEIIVCFLCVSAVQNHIIKNVNSSSSTINDLPISQNHTRKLLELCFSNRMNPVAISKDLVRVFHGITDNSESNISVMAIDENLNWWRYEGSNFLTYPSFATIILSVDSVEGHCTKSRSFECYSRRIVHIKNQFMKLNHWSSTTTFLITGNQCSDASKVLGWLWEKEVLISYFICPNEFNNNTMIYTMNPFGDRAPKPWEKVEPPEKPCDVCTFYRMLFINDAGICSSVTFDKSEFLNGYKFVKPDSRLENLRKTKFFYENLWSAMNITPTKFRSGAGRGHLQIRVTDPLPFDYSMKILHNIIPYFEEGGYVIVTQKKSFVPTLDQVIDSFFTRERIVILSVILIVIFLMMFLNNRYDFSATILDLLAFLLDMRISTPILRLSMRITFMSATLFALIFNPELQGQVISLLSRPGYRNVQSLKDLIDHNYRVYFRSDEITNKLRENQLWDDDLVAHYWHSFSRQKNQDTCLTYVRNNSSTACIIDYTEIEHIDEKLHYSKEFSHKSHVFLTMRHFLLNEKINKIALKLFETGHLSYAERREFHRILFERKRKIERIKALMKYNQLDLEDFELAYISMTLALAWAIIIFGIEVLIKKILNFLDRRARESEMRKLMIRKTIASTVRRIAIITQQL